MLGAAPDIDVFQVPIINELANLFLGDLETGRDLLDRQQRVRRCCARGRSGRYFQFCRGLPIPKFLQGRVRVCL
jgi:hypothetical protein